LRNLESQVPRKEKGTNRKKGKVGHNSKKGTTVKPTGQIPKRRGREKEFSEKKGILARCLKKGREGGRMRTYVEGSVPVRLSEGFELR